MSVKETFWSRNFIFLMISNALLFMAFEMLMPTLPLFVESLGGSPSQIGLVTGVFMCSAILIRPFSGTLIQLLDKKYVLIIGVVICMLATGSYMLSTSLVLLLVFRLVHGFGFGIASTLYATSASDDLPPHRMGEGMGYFGVGETVAISVGPLLGIWMLHVAGFSGLFSTGAIILLLSLVMSIWVRRRSANPTTADTAKDKKRVPFKLFEKRVLLQSGLVLLIGVVAGGVMSFVALFAKEQGFTNAAWFFFTVAMASFLVRLVSGRIFDTKGPAYILIPAGIVLIVAIVMVASSRTELQFLIAAVLYGSSFGAIFPALQAWAISVVGEDEREDAVGSFYNFFDLGVGGGSLILGMAAGLTSYKTMYLFSTLLIAVYLIIFVVYSVLDKKKSRNTLNV
ncbi:MFS transporter [Paenibacillus sp. EKM202P]|uniref:MFS transporter n=1 Tax=unclassified Paenibacillus TaxID=185978 RepID=UPI0013EBEFC3|nr:MULTISPECIES: MFS transporter [unclassified Paenibacillus]KAF6562845.1 MFS transporter [Paenibacillus sp. EKM202P]KAF6568993.1 MFS transporter [Paenibacillus sp. EKM207P]